MYSSKLRLVVFVILTLSGFVPASAGAFSLEGYFSGKTSAVGSFSAINGVKRDFTVDLRGTWNGQTLTLVEDFVYSDGERDRKTWRFRKIAPNQYRGTREDVVGDTLVTITGNTARFTYLVDLDAARKRNRVRFHDTMTLQDNGRLINNATITKFGLPVAKTRVEFSR
ncbi:DUF3833 family protein [Kaistia granuli]|uniref:DUF3833 family protein n=1 Tax=Kaistia granuli TaxID=363259 RepID=UPI00035F9AA0|nr:DUF3833 family protein [Kaistia granuli]